MSSLGRSAAHLALTMLVGGLGLAAVACSDDDGAGGGAGDDRDAASYCADVEVLMTLLDDGGTVAEYNDLLSAVVEASPEGHRDAWELMLTLSEEPFTYDNFNPAVDALERIDLDATCPAAEVLIVDDSGRVRSF